MRMNIVTLHHSGAAAAALVLVSLLSACGDDAGEPGDDVGASDVADSGSDAVDTEESDAGADDAGDTGTDSAEDVSPDAGSDAEPDTDLDGGSDDADPGDTGSDIDAVDGGDTFDGDTGTEASLLGAACSADEECGDGLCLSGFCTLRCSGEGASATACDEAAGDAALVSPVWSCAADFAYCAPVDAGSLARCAADDDCDGRGDNLVCATLTDTAGGVERICLPASARAANGAECSADADCASFWCADSTCVSACDERNDCQADALCLPLETTLGEAGFCVAIGDGNCIVGETVCDEGVCTGDDTLPPGVGRCFVAVGDCSVDTDCDDGVACTTNTCVGGECVYAPNDGFCADDFACTTNTCDAVAGCQVATNNSLCNDDIACTNDTCSATTGCSFAPVNSRCDDGVACTTDSCSAETGCVATPVNSRCDDGIACTDDVCDLVDGCEITPVNSRCEDTFACTTNFCDLETGCGFTPDNSACDDANSCTNDICGAAGCTNPDNGTCPDVPTYAEARSVYSARCAGCHTSSSFGGFRATVYSTFFLNAISCAGQNKGQCSLTRIRNGTMPPSIGCTGNPVTDAGRAGCLNQAEHTLLETWIDAGMPE